MYLVPRIEIIFLYLWYYYSKFKLAASTCSEWSYEYCAGEMPDSKVSQLSEIVLLNNNYCHSFGDM